MQGEAITLCGRLMEAELLLGRLGSACRALKELQAEDARLVAESCRESFEVLPDSSSGGQTSVGSAGGSSAEGPPAKPAGLQPKQLEGSLLAASEARAAAPGQGKLPRPQSPPMTVIESGQESEAPGSEESVEQQVGSEDSSAPSGEDGQACGADGQLVQLSAVCDTEEKGQEQEQQQQQPSYDGLEQTPPPAGGSRCAQTACMHQLSLWSAGLSTARPPMPRRLAAASAACPTTRTRPRPPVSYALPSLNSKLRQGDSGTFGEVSTPMHKGPTRQSSKESARKAP